jgi:hypothetical protein
MKSDKDYYDRHNDNHKYFVTNSVQKLWIYLITSYTLTHNFTLWSCIRYKDNFIVLPLFQPQLYNTLLQKQCIHMQSRNINDPIITVIFASSPQ